MYRHSAALLALVLLAVPLSGCLGGDDDGGGDPPTTPPPDDPDQGPDVPQQPQPLTASTPEWIVGEWWQWRIDHQLGGTVELRTVVTGGDSTTYRVGVLDRDAGLQAVVFHLPPMGEVTRPHLAWEAHDQPVDLLQFPISDGMKWTGEISGDQLALEATAVEVTTPLGTEPAFQVTGTREDGSTAIDYTYSVLAGSFLKLVRYGENGEPFVTLTMTDHGFNEGRPALVMTVDDAFLGAAGTPGPAPLPPTPPANPATFTVPDDGDVLVLANFMGGGTGTYTANYQTPDGQTITFRQDNQPGDEAVTLQASNEEPQPGQWTVTLVSGGEGFVFAEVMLVRISEVVPG